jgi:hypothetical protein
MARVTSRRRTTWPARRRDRLRDSGLVGEEEETAESAGDAGSERPRFGWEQWAWDPSLFGGSASYYRRGRIPYAEGLADSLATALELDGQGRPLIGEEA